jgi:Ca2+-binding EF-hand superfamily protein
LEFLSFVKGEDQMTKDLRAELREILITHVFKVQTGADVTEVQLASAFMHFDKDGNGKVTIQEFKDAAVSLGCSPSAEELNLLIALFDENKDGTVSYLEFMKLVVGEKQVTAMARVKLRAYLCEKVFKVPTAASISRDQIVALFQTFDIDGSGVITLDEFRQARVNYGINPEAEELEVLVSVFDVSHF